jgi:hypothetical protein
MEETMFRSLAPWSIRPLLILAAAASGLALGLNSLDSRADHAEKRKAIAKEDLRYDGKTFDEWKVLLQTELKPERRAEAIRALGAFAPKGYTKEAAVAILEAMREIDFEAHDVENLPVEAAETAFAKMGPEKFLPVLDELKQGPPNGRHFAIVRLFDCKDARSKQVLLEALKDKDLYIRTNAFTILYWHADHKEREWQILVPALITSLESNDEGEFKLTEQLLKGVEREHTKALPLVVKATKHADSRVRACALERLAEVCPDHKLLNSIVVNALDDEDGGVRNTGRKHLKTLGPGVSEAVPVLIAELKKKVKEANDKPKKEPVRHQTFVPSLPLSNGDFDSETAEIVESLGKLGPIAKEAVPVLSLLAKSEKGTELGRTVEAALEEIKPPPDQPRTKKDSY